MDSERDCRFGRGLAALMVAESISVTMLAEWVGVSTVSVYSWAQGRAYPHGGNLSKIESIFRMTADEIAALEPSDTAKKLDDVRIPSAQCYIERYRSGLQRYMLQHGISASDIARNIGVRPATVVRWINGVYNPSTGHCLQISEYLGATIEALAALGDSDDEES